jgi:hypothetical protein
MRILFMTSVLVASAAAFAQAPGVAKPVAPAAAVGATDKIAKLAQAHNTGRPDGGPWAGKFETGQILRQPFQIMPGKCYSVVAVGLDGIKELDAQIVLQTPPMPPLVAAQDTMTGPDAVIGDAKSGCFKNPTGLTSPATVVLKATQGAGLVAAQIFVK